MDAFLKIFDLIYMHDTKVDDGINDFLVCIVVLPKQYINQPMCNRMVSHVMWVLPDMCNGFEKL